MLEGGATVGVLVRKLMNGLERLPVYNAKMSDSNAIAVGILGAGIGAAGLFFGIRDVGIGNLLTSWMSKGQDTCNPSRHVAGLRNLGNNCFFNVVLQALASCDCFFSYLEGMLNMKDLEFEEVQEKMPLTTALACLLNDLHIIHQKAVVLNPINVMIAMGCYLTGFSLIGQQDASEAFLLLMSSLEEEFLECYIPYRGSLADIMASGNDVSLMQENSDNLRQWQKLRFGPFDGVIANMLFCANCSLQLSINFEMFRCLPLSPVLEDYSTVIDGCTVTDCLRKLTSMERLDSNHCSRCWHNMALKYLSSRSEENEEKIKIIGSCFNQDFCDCTNLFNLEVNWWSKGFSNTFKYSWIAHCPKVLCLQVLRSSLNHHGEIFKLKNHVSFLPVLDLLPFTIEEKVGKSVHIGNPGNDPELAPYNLPGYVSVCNTKNEKDSLPVIGRMVPVEFSNMYDFSSHKNLMQHGQECEDLLASNFKSYKYRLVSVIEHYGNPGHGHYAVYKKLGRANVGDSQFDSLDQDWFYISDAHVSSVTLDAVLSAEASLLYYERI